MQAPELPGVKFGAEHNDYFAPLAGDQPDGPPGECCGATGQLHFGEFPGCFSEQREMAGRADRRHIMFHVFQIPA